MSIQPHWRVMEYTWCPCGARIVTPPDDLCVLCQAHLRLSDIELEDNDWTEDCG